jgi:hypothetical protein
MATEPMLAALDIPMMVPDNDARFTFQMSIVSARRLLFASILNLPVLFTLLAFDKKQM